MAHISWSEVRDRAIRFSREWTITYTLQLCVIGGSTGAGDWSDPVSHMAM